MTVGKHLLHFTLISESNKTNVPSLGPQSQKQTNNMVGKKKKRRKSGQSKKNVCSCCGWSPGVWGKDEAQLLLKTSRQRQ